MSESSKINGISGKLIAVDEQDRRWTEKLLAQDFSSSGLIDNWATPAYWPPIDESIQMTDQKPTEVSQFWKDLYGTPEPVEMASEMRFNPPLLDLAVFNQALADKKLTVEDLAPIPDPSETLAGYHRRMAVAALAHSVAGYMNGDIEDDDNDDGMQEEDTVEQTSISADTIRISATHQPGAFTTNGGIVIRDAGRDEAGMMWVEISDGGETVRLSHLDFENLQDRTAEANHLHERLDSMAQRLSSAHEAVQTYRAELDDAIGRNQEQATRIAELTAQLAALTTAPKPAGSAPPASAAKPVLPATGYRW